MTKTGTGLGESVTTTGKQFFGIALSGLPRHKDVDEIAGDLARYRKKGYTGVWVENDYVRGDMAVSGGSGEITDNWRLFNIFDFTFGEARDDYRAYLQKLCAACERSGLEVYVAFWMPMLNAEMLAYLRKHQPEAIGRTDSFTEKGIPCICTCEQGGGLEFLGSMVEKFMRDFPRVRGLKVSTEDNHALNCESTCPNSGDTGRAEHAANMFSCVQQAMLRARADARFLLYPWFWREGYAERILPRLNPDYLVVTKMERGSAQKLESGGAGEPLFDSSMVSGAPGHYFLDWVERVGADRIIDMVPAGNGIDDFFLANPPHPGRLYRRFKCLAQHGVRNFLDFECGGHTAGSLEETVALFNTRQELDEEAFLTELAAICYSDATARKRAVEGWRAFDRGFGMLPVGLGETGIRFFSGRFGFAWSMCIATPLVRKMFGPDRGHEIHWFSPYNFFHGPVALRLENAFQQVLEQWEESARCLRMANELEHESEFSAREAASAEAQVLCVRSALNWCKAALQSDSGGGFEKVVLEEIDTTGKFVALLEAHPWLWSNNCWHPQRTPKSQKGIGFLQGDGEDVFQAKLRIMRAGGTGRE